MALKLKAPDGIRIPEDTEEGETFDSMVTFKLLKGGMLELTAIQGEPCGYGAKKKMSVAERYETEMNGE